MQHFFKLFLTPCALLFAFSCQLFASQTDLRVFNEKLITTAESAMETVSIAIAEEKKRLLEKERFIIESKKKIQRLLNMRGISIHDFMDLKRMERRMLKLEEEVQNEFRKLREAEEAGRVTYRGLENFRRNHIDNLSE